jgi:hypothetical protein
MRAAVLFPAVASVVATRLPAQPRFLVRLQLLTHHQGPAQAASRAQAEATGSQRS